MQTSESLNRRVNVLTSLQNVVRGMKMLSAVNEAPYTRAASTIDTYHASVLEGLQVALRGAVAPQVREARIGYRVVILFGSDHGLCGGYNESVMAAAEPLLSAGTDFLIAVGARMNSILLPGRTPTKTLTPPASVDGIERFAREALIAIDAAHDEAAISITSAGGIAGADVGVTLVHMRRKEQGQRSVHSTSLLPLDADFLAQLAHKPWDSNSLPTFSMDRQQLLSSLIRQHLFASLFKAAAEAMSAENTARLELMRQAERAIDERLAELESVLRTARQAKITSELLDVIAGMDATRDDATSVNTAHRTTLL